MIDRAIFFDCVREKPFGGSLDQQQVDGMNAILDAWEADYADNDLRWLANALAQTYHEVSGTMWPISEYNKGAGQPYGETDPETGQAYYGRGLIQCTWRENYARADKELGLLGDESCEWFADNMLKPDIAASCLFEGMIEGWYRSSGGTPNNLEKYFSDTVNDTFNAREIINGDKNVVPSWSPGISIGNLIVGYHNNFLSALEESYVEEIVPEPVVVAQHFMITVTGRGPFTVIVDKVEDS
jgi:hypothetical protein